MLYTWAQLSTIQVALRALSILIQTKQATLLEFILFAYHRNERNMIQYFSKDHEARR